MGLEEKRRNRAEAEAERRLELMGGTIDLYAKCPSLKNDGRTSCDNRAGHLTSHLGAGKCQPHGGNGRFEALVAEIMLSHKAARALNVTPWEALLNAMRRAAGLAHFYDSKIAAVTDDNDLRPGGAAFDWILGSERAHHNTARYAKAALDAGVAEKLVQGMQAEAGIIYTLFAKLLEELRMTPEMEERARLILRREALALETAGQLVEEDEDDDNVISGTLVEGGDSHGDS